MKSNKIEINKSSLVSLKAELLRKQDEVRQAKLNAQAQYIHPVPKPKKETIFSKKNVGIDQRNEKDVEEKKEEEDVFRQSRLALEAKSKLYDELSKGSTTALTDNEVYLVNFEEKVIENQSSGSAADTEKTDIITHTEDKSVKETSHNILDTNKDSCDDDDDDGWVEYVDCLGRTRQCLKEDLQFVKEKDKKLAGSLGYFDKREAGDVKDEKTVELELMSGDMKRELMRQKWEEQEEQLRDKKDVHYQDVLFDEARTHGVGYYAFSSDETKRKSEQEELAKIRQETQQQQEKAQAARERRQQMLQARLKAARRRKRERLGLPPEDDENEEAVDGAEETPILQEEKKEPESQNAELPKPATVRPWDIGKPGVTETSVMSQEEWVKKRRMDRTEEFAPPTLYQSEMSPSCSYEPSTSKQTYEPSVSKQRLFFTSKRTAQGKWKIKQTCESSEEQLGDVTCSTENVGDIAYKDDTTRRGVEIPPPPTFNYYGPTLSTHRNVTSGNNSTKEDIENSIVAGLRYLREQAEEREKQQEKGLLDIM